jgi:hypothetical protein
MAIINGKKKMEWVIKPTAAIVLPTIKGIVSLCLGLLMVNMSCMSKEGVFFFLFIIKL